MDKGRSQGKPSNTNKSKGCVLWWRCLFSAPIAILPWIILCTPRRSSISLYFSGQIGWPTHPTLSPMRNIGFAAAPCYQNAVCPQWAGTQNSICGGSCPTYLASVPFDLLLQVLFLTPVPCCLPTPVPFDTVMPRTTTYPLISLFPH